MNSVTVEKVNVGDFVYYTNLYYMCERLAA